MPLEVSPDKVSLSANKDRAINFQERVNDSELEIISRLSTNPFLPGAWPQASSVLTSKSFISFRRKLEMDQKDHDKG